MFVCGSSVVTGATLVSKLSYNTAITIARLAMYTTFKYLAKFPCLSYWCLSS